MQDTNTRFNELLQDERLLRIAESATKKYGGRLTKDDIRRCILMAVWKAINKHDDELGLKFTTFVYRGVVMECMTALKENRESNKKKKKFRISNKQEAIDFLLDHRFSEYDRIDLMEEVGAVENGEILIDRHIQNHTVKEIALKYDRSIETIRQRMIKSKNLLIERSI